MATEPTDADIEEMAAAVHQAYLDTCERLGWLVKPANQVPYEDLDEDSKELDRASVRAVLAFTESQLEDVHALCVTAQQYEDVLALLADAVGVVREAATRCRFTGFMDHTARQLDALADRLDGKDTGDE